MNGPVDSSADGLPFVSIVLPVLNGASRLELALGALQRQDYPKSKFEIIVADGRSKDDTARIAESFGCRVIDNPGVTVAAGRNVGIRHARGDLIAFSEDDIILPPHWISEAVRLMQTSGAAGIGGPTPIPSTSSLWSRAVNAVFRTASARGASVQSDRAVTGVVDDLPGGNSIYSAEALRAVAPIDESLATAEDVDMHHKLRRRGWELRLCAGLAAEHHKRDSVPGFFNQMQRFAIGRVQLFRRWRGALKPIHWLMAAVGPLIGAGVTFAYLANAIIESALIALIVALGAILVALRQHERPAVAALFPLALLVFIAGWSLGFWSEWALPTRDPRRTRLIQRMSDLLQNACLEGSRGLRWFTPAWLALMCLSLARFSQHAPFIMDEFQQGGYARHIDAGYYAAVVPFKTVLFTYVYYLPRLFFEDARSILLFQRAETVGLVLGTLAMLYGVSRCIGRTRLESLLVVIVVLSISTFFEHCCSLRAEPSALLLATGALYVGISGRPNSSRWREIVAGAMLGGAFFCTQKAIWFCVSVGLGLVARTWLDCRTESRVSLVECGTTLIASGARISFGFAVVAAAYCFAFAPATPAQVFRGVFLRSSQYALEGRGIYGDMSVFLEQSIERNWALYAACFVGCVLAVVRLKEAKLACCWVTVISMTGFVLSWKEPWPYVLTWWIPFMALFAPETFRIAGHFVSRITPGRWRPLGMAVALLVPIGLSVPRKIEVLAWDNHQQLAVVDYVESLLAPGEFYQDGIGMISTRNLSGLVWWDARAIARISRAARGGNHDELTSAFEDAPKVLVMNYRLANLGAALSPFLQDSYVPIDGGLMIAGVRLRAVGASAFEARWAGRYGLVHLDGRRSEQSWMLDGKEMWGPAEISRGAHEVASYGCNDCVLMPDDAIGKATPVEAPQVAALFDRPYTR